MNKKKFIKWPRLLLLFGFNILLVACGHQKEGCWADSAAEATTVPLKLERLEQPFFQLKNQGQTLAFLRQHPLFSRLYLQLQPGQASQMATALTELATNKDLQKLSRETAFAFADSAGLRQNLQEMFRRVHYYFPDFRVPLVYTYVSGFQGKDIFVNDSLLVLSLDWFAGPKASYRPDLPHYMLSRYNSAHLLPMLAQTIASKYNRHELTANSVLDAMLHDGKVLYFASQVLPCTADSLLLGYTGKQLEALQVNEARVWGHFLENNLLYSTTPFLVQKYVSERPNVPEIDKTCPGRVGQWVGLQIVRKYMTEHPEVSLSKLMAEKNSQKLLNDSHYRPKK